MITASQDIDYFVERQRSKLNKSNNRQPVNRQRLAPPPPQQQPPPPFSQSLSAQPVDDRLDFKVARILNEPSPRSQTQRSYIPPSPLPTITSPYPDSQTAYYDSQQQPQQQRRFENDSGNNNINEFGFFDRFGGHEGKRAQLKEDLKREYNDFLRTHRGPKNKSTAQVAPARGNTTRRVQFAQDGLVVAPWEKNGNKKSNVNNAQNTNDIFSPSVTPREYPASRTLSRIPEAHNEDYIRAREEYILELYEQIRELEARKRQLELESSKLAPSNSNNVTRAHYAEDLTALNTLLAERLNQRNAIDHELARILNRPPVSTTSSNVISSSGPNLSLSFESANNSSPQRNQQQNRNDNRQRRNNNNGGFQIGRETDKEAEQAAKKRYQQELQAQMRETKMRKAQAKQEKDEYEKKLEAEISRYNYFGRSGGGAPMRDKDGNVIANLGGLRNPDPQYQTPRANQPYTAFDDKIYSLGVGPSSITNAPFYNGDQSNPLNSGRLSTPNHARGAVSNGIFGTVKSEEQVMREEKYKQDLKKQIDEKRQRNADELARRRAEEERELAKHIEWQQQVEKQTAEETARKQEKEAQERVHQQRMQEELERQRKQEEIAMKRKPKRSAKPRTPKNEDDGAADRQDTYDENQQDEPAYRSSSPPVPTLKNKDKKRKSNQNLERQPSFEDASQEQLPLATDNNDEFTQPRVDGNDDQGQETFQKSPTPKKQDLPPARKKPTQAHRPPPKVSYHTHGPYRTNSTISLRSDGSDSEVLNRLEHLKQQLKDKEARLHQHTKSQGALLSDIDEQVPTSYVPPSQQPLHYRQSPTYIPTTTHLPFQTGLSTHDKMLRVLQTDDDDEFKPSYFRDDSILMRGGGGGGLTGADYIPPSKRVDLVDGIFVTNLEDAARRRRYGYDPPGFFDSDDPTSMANLELGRIAEQNEHRLKKLRELEKDDTSLLDSNEVLERFQQRQRLQPRGSQLTLQDDAWLK